MGIINKRPYILSDINWLKPSRNVFKSADSLGDGIMFYAKAVGRGCCSKDVAQVVDADKVRINVELP